MLKVKELIKQLEKIEDKDKYLCLDIGKEYGYVVKVKEHCGSVDLYGE